MPKPRACPRPSLGDLHDDDFVRLPEILRAFPVGKSSWDRGVAEGRYPKPVRLSPRVVAWRVRTIRALLASFDGGSGGW